MAGLQLVQPLRCQNKLSQFIWAQRGECSLARSLACSPARPSNKDDVQRGAN